MRFVCDFILQKFLFGCRHEPVLRDGIDSCAAKTLFETAWTLLSSRFFDLCGFCCCIATIFPVTATAWPDCSVFLLEKNDFRKRLSDFGPEGEIQSKQHYSLEAFAAQGVVYSCCANLAHNEHTCPLAPALISSSLASREPLELC